MIEGTVYTALQSLVSGRCYPSIFPQPAGVLPTWPAIRYSVITGTNVADICGTDDVDTDDTIVQIDAVALTHGAVLSLRDQIIAAMQGLTPPATRQNMFVTFDEETKTHRAVLDYLFCASSAGSP